MSTVRIILGSIVLYILVSLSMGADNSTAIKFWEKHHDDAFLSVALWHPAIGYWCGYLGRVNGEPLPPDTYFHCGGAAGGMSTAMIPEIGVDIQVIGFDTMHGNDSNIGPNNEIGASNVGSSEFSRSHEILWTKEKVFARLREVADEILNPTTTDEA